MGTLCFRAQGQLLPQQHPNHSLQASSGGRGMILEFANASKKLGYIGAWRKSEWLEAGTSIAFLL